MGMHSDGHDGYSAAHRGTGVLVALQATPITYPGSSSRKGRGNEAKAKASGNIPAVPL